MPCIQCGWCCKHIAVIYPQDDLREEFMLARGWKKLQTSKDGRLVQWLGKMRCPNLGSDDRCKIYAKRPRGCKVYPHALLLSKIQMDPHVGIGRHCGWKWDGEKYV